MSTQYGLTSLGFVLKPQSQIISDLETAFQAVFGQNVNLNPESNFGQIIGIISEQIALPWQIAQAVYSSQYPAGAEGTSVDNILALNNLRRLLASPTRTASSSVTQSDGITLYPLVLYGTAGTVIPAGSVVQTTSSPPIQFTLNSSVTIMAASNAVQSIYTSNTPTTGSFSLSIVDSFGNTLTTELIQWNALSAQSLLNFSALPAASSSFKLVLTQAGVALTTAAISTNAAYPTAAAIQGAITALSGYAGVTVSGSAGSYIISWGAIANPITTVTANTTTVAITPTDSVQAAINNLFDSSESLYPFTDASVTVNASGYSVNFGNMAPVGGQPSSGFQPQPLFLIVTNTLMMNSNVTNLQVVNTTIGSPAEGIGSATCTITGPNFVGAGSLTSIGTPVSGWTGVTNQLDCLTGTNVENDTQALVRRDTLLNSNGNGTLLAIEEKVSQVPEVTQVIGFENLNEAALQNISFSFTPVTGHYVLVLGGYPTAPIPYNSDAAQIQAAINLITQFSTVLVTGNLTSGFTVDFNGSLGGQPMNLIIVTNNTTGVAINVSFGRPGKSIEIVVQGGDDTAIAQAILASKDAGIQTYGNTGPIQVFDSNNDSFLIFFSRPTEVPIYIVLSMLTDTYNIPGNPGSGLNPQAKFSPSSISTIQQDLVNIGNAFPIGGIVIGFGSFGLIGAFNSVPGIIDYTMSFGTSPNPTMDVNIPLLPEEVAVFETFNVAVSYT
jgi:hypothetical protein